MVLVKLFPQLIDHTWTISVKFFALQKLLKMAATFHLSKKQLKSITNLLRRLISIPASSPEFFYFYSRIVYRLSFGKLMTRMRSFIKIPATILTPFILSLCLTVHTKTPWHSCQPRRLRTISFVRLTRLCYFKTSASLSLNSEFTFRLVVDVELLNLS